MHLHTTNGLALPAADPDAGAGQDAETGAATVPLAPIARLLLTPTEAAAALGISPRLLWSKTKGGEIPCMRIGKAVRYSPTALQEWIARSGE